MYHRFKLMIDMRKLIQQAGVAFDMKKFYVIGTNVVGGKVLTTPYRVAGGFTKTVLKISKVWLCFDTDIRKPSDVRRSPTHRETCKNEERYEPHSS